MTTNRSEFRAYIKDGKLVVVETVVVSRTRRSVTYRQRTVGAAEFGKTTKVLHNYFLRGCETAEQAVADLRLRATLHKKDALERLKDAEETIAVVGESETQEGK